MSEAVLLILLVTWSADYMSFAIEKVSPKTYDTLLKSNMYLRANERNIYYGFERAKEFQLILTVLYEPIYFQKFTESPSYQKFIQIEEVSKLYQLNNIKEKNTPKYAEVANILKSNIFKSEELYDLVTQPEWLEDCKSSLPESVLNEYMSRHGLFK